jgi:hypothetical protein
MALSGADLRPHRFLTDESTSSLYKTNTSNTVFTAEFRFPFTSDLAIKQPKNQRENS